MIKVLLVAALAAAAWMVVRGRPTALNLLARRVMTLTTILAGIVGVLFPSLVSEVAVAVGVGRGTDLVLYVFCVAFLFVSISLYMRLGQVQDRLVEVARAHALLEAEVRSGRPGDAP